MNLIRKAINRLRFGKKLRKVEPVNNLELTNPCCYPELTKIFVAQKLQIPKAKPLHQSIPIKTNNTQIESELACKSFHGQKTVNESLIYFAQDVETFDILHGTNENSCLNSYEDTIVTDSQNEFMQNERTAFGSQNKEEDDFPNSSEISINVTNSQIDYMQNEETTYGSRDKEDNGCPNRSRDLIKVKDSQVDSRHDENTCTTPGPQDNEVDRIQDSYEYLIKVKDNQIDSRHDENTTPGPQDNEIDSCPDFLGDQIKVRNSPNASKHDENTSNGPQNNEVDSISTAVHTSAQANVPTVGPLTKDILNRAVPYLSDNAEEPFVYEERRRETKEEASLKAKIKWILMRMMMFCLNPAEAEAAIQQNDLTKLIARKKGNLHTVLGYHYIIRSICTRIFSLIPSEFNLTDFLRQQSISITYISAKLVCYFLERLINNSKILSKHPRIFFALAIFCRFNVADGLKIGDIVFENSELTTVCYTAITCVGMTGIFTCICVVSPRSAHICNFTECGVGCSDNQPFDGMKKKNSDNNIEIQELKNKIFVLVFDNIPFDKSKWKKFTLFLESYLSPVAISEAKSVLPLLRDLFDDNVISISNYSVLINILKIIKLTRIANQIEKYQNTIRELQNKASVEWNQCPNGHIY